MGMDVMPLVKGDGSKLLGYTSWKDIDFGLGFGRWLEVSQRFLLGRFLLKKGMT